MRRKKVTAGAWVVAGPPPHLAKCLRCGETLPVPPLPATIDEVLAYMRPFEAKHAGCKEVYAHA